MPAFDLNTSTNYFVIFGVESGDRMELYLSDPEYGLLIACCNLNHPYDNIEDLKIGIRLVNELA